MSVSAHVQKNSLNKDGFTEYFILILYKGSEWGIRKRYSDFVQFDLYLQQSGYEVFHKLPEKNFWSRLDPTLISKRMVELQNYLSTLLQNTLSTDNNLIREFLEVDENTLAMAIKQSKREPHKETSWAERLNVIVKDTRKTMVGIEPFFRGSTNRHNAMTRTRQYSIMQGNISSTGGSSNLTPPASPLQSNNRNNSFVTSTSRSPSTERRLGSMSSGVPPPQSPPSNTHSPQVTPHGSFSQLTQQQRGTSFGFSNAENNKSTGHPRDSRDGRVSSINQGSNRFLLNGYSGQSALDVALAIEDAHRREAFSIHVAKVWNKQADPTMTGIKKSDVYNVMKSILQKEDNTYEKIPLPYTQENEVLYMQRDDGFRPRRGTGTESESESDTEGAMFRDDKNSFILDCLSEPIPTILNPQGLALHETLDVQADSFQDLCQKRRPKVFSQLGEVFIRRDWMMNNTNATSQQDDANSAVVNPVRSVRSQSEIQPDAGDTLPSLRRIKSEAANANN